jgi:carboxypeptidase Q
MNWQSVFLLSILLVPTVVSGQLEPKQTREADLIIQSALKDSVGFSRLAYMCDTFGPRFSGTPALEKAIDWIVAEMKKDGFDSVYTQPVKVPNWVRGSESATLITPRKKSLAMLGLGGSIGTSAKGIRAEVLVVRSFEELQANPERAKGKIVLFNVPFVAYGQTVRIRTLGAIEAAKAGAVASLIRSVGPFSMNTPHTGNSRYEDGVPKIPHAAITSEDAQMLQRMQERGEKIVIELKMEAKTLPDANSRNVIAEIRGYEKPEEVVVLGGHIDSWDVGTGAMDDGGGCLASWEALRQIKLLGLKPRRTVRVVLWTNEENGLRGAEAYRKLVDAELHNHVLAIESDSGVFEPQGFGFTGSEQAYNQLQEVISLLAPVGATNLFKGGGGADIGPLMRDGVPGMGLIVDGSKYFWYHHTEADTIDKLSLSEFQKCVAAMGVMSYVVADMPARLIRN